jgi:hypothetical protein
MARRRAQAAARSGLSRTSTGHPIDRFSFFFAFYGLILGLAVTELLGGFARLVRARVARVEPQTALLAVLTFVIIVATWIDAWETLREVKLNLAGLSAPILLATAYYLAASVVFPSDPADFDDLDSYYASRKGFVLAMLAAAELLVTVTTGPVYVFVFESRPAEFWIWMVPFKIAIFAAFLTIYLARSRRANIIALAVTLLMFSLPYWQYGIVRETIARHFGYRL